MTVATEPLNSTKASELIRTTTGRNCSRQNLEKLCRQGRLPRSCVSLTPIRLDPDLLVAEYLGHVDPRQQRASARPPSPPPPPAPVTDEQLRAFIQGLPEDAIPDLNESRARREHYAAEKARLEALQGRGELITAADVKKEAFSLARAVRDALMTIPDRLAPELAACTDARQVHQLLSDEIRVALRGLSNG